MSQYRKMAEALHAGVAKAGSAELARARRQAAFKLEELADLEDIYASPPAPAAPEKSEPSGED